jgi:lambda repressor-like predicted transcriptional regulator
MTEGGSQDEWRKKIFAKLRQSPSCIVIDNVKNKISSSALEAALTTEYFEDRVLGISEMKSVPVKCAWVATGNNLQFDAEMARRTIRIRLDAKCEQPWLRTKFKYPDIEAWALTNRKKLIWAGLTMIQAWIAAGKPPGEKVLGSYESWSKVMGGILKVCKIDGFLENLQEFYLESDDESQKIAAFVELWHSQRGTEEVRASDLLDQATEAGIDLGSGGDRSVKTRMGTLVASLNGKIFGKHVITRAGLILGVRRWRLVEKNVISTTTVNEPGGRGEP